jgi:SAM-dependent methyltransferase
MQQDWNGQYEYLARTRSLYHNDDYFEFLLGKVWKTEGPARIIDFGCGYGYLGLKLLPLLHPDSSYTGIDTARDLLDKAKTIYGACPNGHDFVEASVYAVPFEDDSFDLAVCHAVMMHLERPEEAILEMKRVVRDGGRVIIIESNWNAMSAQTQVDGIDKSETTDLGFLQRLFEEQRKLKKVDGNIGMKIPLMLDRAGFRGVEARISDCVRLLRHDMPKVERESLCESLRNDGFGVVWDPAESERRVRRLMDYGFPEAESRRQIEQELRQNRHIAGNAEDLAMAFASVMTYSSGIVDKSA